MGSNAKVAAVLAASFVLIVSVALQLDNYNAQPPPTPEEQTSSPAMETVRRIHTPEELDIGLDTQGRPYDAGNASNWADRVERSFLTAFVAPIGSVWVMDGNGVEVNPFFFRVEEAEVVFPTDELDLFVHREFFERDDGAWDQVLAIELVAPGSIVAAWDEFEFGYGTDGGVGGLVTQEVIDKAELHQQAFEQRLDRPSACDMALALEIQQMVNASNADVQDLDQESAEPTTADASITDRCFAELANRPSIEDDFFIARDYQQEIELRDMDGIPGTDTIVFANGQGDGAFPMVRGRDENGTVVALVVFDNRYPWRLMFPDTPPPADVSKREQELAECLEGKRDVEVWSFEGGDDARYCVDDEG